MFELSERQFYLIMWSMVFGVITVLIIVLHNNDLDDSKRLLNTHEISASAESLKRKEIIAHELAMAKLGYTQKRAVNCIKDKCTTDLIWAKNNKTIIEK